MNRMGKLTSFRGAVALAAILIMNGAALAKKPDAGGVPAQLSADRTSVDLSINYQCDHAERPG